MVRFPRGDASPRAGARALLGPLSDADRRDALREAARLHELDEFRSWFLPHEQLELLHLKIQEVESSELYINDAQREEQRVAAFRRVAEEYFSGPERELQAARIEAMTDYLLWSDREAEARLALAVADHLADPECDINENAFAMAMIDKIHRRAGAVPASEGSSAEEESGGGLIVPS